MVLVCCMLLVVFGVVPQTGLPVGFYLRKKRLDTLVGALCCVGRGFGCVGRGFGFLCMVYIVHVFFMSS